MINDFDLFPSSEEVISLATAIEISETNKIVKSLIERHYLRKNILNNLLQVSIIYSIKDVRLFQIYDWRN